MGYTKIKTELLDLQDEGTHLVMPVVVNGQKHNFIIDTGASRTIFNLSHFRDVIWDFSPLEQEGIKTAGVTDSPIVSYKGRLNVVKLGRLVLENKEWVFIDLEHVNQLYKELLGMEVSGLIGGDLLSEHNSLISYEKGYIRFNL